MKSLKTLCIGLIGMATLVSACASDEAVFGKVVDAQSMEGIPDAFVVAVWTHRGASLVGSRTTCYQFEVTKSNSLGEYRISVGRGRADELYVTGYKRGLQRVPARDQQGQLVLDPQVYGRRDIVMQPFDGTQNDRYDRLGYFDTLRACSGKWKDKEQKLRPLFRALDEEVATLRVDGGVRVNAADRFTRTLDDWDRFQKGDRR